MMPAPPAAYAVRMATINNSRVTPAIDRALGYLGLFLIGLIGWVCDRAAVRREGGRAAALHPSEK